MIDALNSARRAASRPAAQHRRPATIGIRLLALCAVLVGLFATTAAVASAQAHRPAAQDPWLLFSARPPGLGGEEIFRMRQSGTGLKQLTSSSFPAEAPAISPDGTKVAFARLGDGLFTMTIDGKGLKRLTANARDSYPAWSPDGTQIVFVRPYSDGWGTFVISASGKGEHRLQQAPPAGRPSWTPKGLVVPTDGDLAKIDPQTGKIQKTFDAFIDVFVGLSTTAVPADLTAVTSVGARTSDPGDKDCGEGVPCPRYALFLQDLRTPQEPKLLVRDAGPAAFSPDGKSLAYVEKGHVIVRVIATGATKLLKTGNVYPTTTSPPAWQPR
jgi:dipeptidyl aminopeptidase/acylaminoacyl peptidase